MKKKICLCMVAILIVSMSVALVACNKDEPQEPDNVSRSVSAYYAGESENFAVSVEKGKREKNFLADGVAIDVCEFAELTLVPLKTHEETSFKFTLASEGKSISGEVKGDTFGEFCTSLNLDFVPEYVLIGEGEERIDLSSLLDGKLTAGDAVNIAKTEFKERIDAEQAEGKQREIYVKLITGDRETYYYYVSFIGEGVDYWAVLINPQDGEVLSKK